MYGFLLIGCAMILFASCTKEWEAELSGDAPRIFRPVIKGPLSAPGNYIELNWQQSEETAKFKVELSIDTFKTIAETKEVVDTTGTIIEDLLWEQLYQVRVTALHPSDAAKNSRPADFGEVKTPRFPTIVENSAAGDIGITSVLFKWRNEGEPVSAIKVVQIDTITAGETELATVALSVSDIDNGFKLIEDLTASSKYRIELYSNAVFRGANTYITKEALTGEILDLQNQDPSIVNLSDVVRDAAAGTTILLKKGATYEITSSLSFAKSVTLRSGIDPLVEDKAKLYLVGISNFNITAGSNIGLIAFVDLEIYTDNRAGKYVFNPNNGGNVDELRFNNCFIHDVRGVARFRGGMTIGHLVIENSVVYKVDGYGIITVDDATTSINNLTIQNSTFYDILTFVTSKNNLGGKLSVAGCTFYDAVTSGRNFIDFGGNTLKANDDIEVTNNIFGRAKASTTTPITYDIYGVYAGGRIVSGGNYGTSDFAWREANNRANVSTILYTKTSEDIFEDPANGNFKIKDNGFPGKDKAGDPRWR